jgi:DNA repair protein RadC
VRSGELLGIPLLDHLIVSDTGFFSFREHGLIS